jgi:transcription initiation factor TFIID TATA-box-binding protein
MGRIHLFIPNYIYKVSYKWNGYHYGGPHLRHFLRNPALSFRLSQESLGYPAILLWEGTPYTIPMDQVLHPSLKIENIVASGIVADSIDLVEVSRKIPNCELNSKRFPGAVFRLENPRIASLIFSSGKVVLTGIRDNQALKEGVKILVGSLQKAGVATFPEPRVTVTNIVCSYDIGKPINLNRVVITLNLENIEYEPEQFPGLVYRITDPKIVALLFSSGKIILTGGKTLEDIHRGLDVLEQRLSHIL